MVIHIVIDCYHSSASDLLMFPISYKQYWNANLADKAYVCLYGTPANLPVLPVATLPHNAQVTLAIPLFLQCCKFPPTLGLLRASLVVQWVKNMTAMRDTWVWYLGWENPLEKGRLPTPVFWPGEFPWTVQSMGSHRVRHNWATFIFRTFAPVVTTT